MNARVAFMSALLVCAFAGQLFEEFEATMMNNNGHVAEKTLLDGVLFGEDQLKEIKIHCPGDIPPIVSVRDIVREAFDSAEESAKCMSLHLTGANFNMKLTINCNGDVE